MSGGKRERKPRPHYTLQLTPNRLGPWTGQLLEEPGCITQGRTIAETRKHMREAVQVFFDSNEPYQGTLVDNVKLPQGARDKLESAAAARRAVVSAEQSASLLTRGAIDALVQLGLSLRDAGELIGVSRQRAHQLANAGREEFRSANKTEARSGSGRLAPSRRKPDGANKGASRQG